MLMTTEYFGEPFNFRRGQLMFALGALAMAMACGNVEEGEDSSSGGGTGSDQGGSSGGSSSAGGADFGGSGGSDAATGGLSASGGMGSDCVPKNCLELDVCGEVQDGCGEVLDCGDCEEPCQPTTCAAENAECGEIEDGCGALLDCGSCEDGACGEEQANTCACVSDGVLDSGPRHAQAARSAGFAGTDAQYSELYEQLCALPADCIPPCIERGGTQEFCAQHVCIDSTEDYCLPPTKWRDLTQLLFEGTSVSDAAVTSLSTSNGDQHDRLLADDFKHEVPSDATIHGITVAVRHAAEGGASDQAVRLIKAGIVGATDRAKPSIWPAEFDVVEYGGLEDLWGEEWTPEDVNAPDFGVAIAALPTPTGSRAYVDIIYTTIHYSIPCD
jgi:hypothetical protein